MVGQGKEGEVGGSFDVCWRMSNKVGEYEDLEVQQTTKEFKWEIIKTSIFKATEETEKQTQHNRKSG